MTVAAVPALLIGCCLIGIICQDAFEVVLLNRPVQRRLRLMLFFFRTSWAVWRSIGNRVKAGPNRESVLGVYGPAALVALFGLWALCIIVGFGLLQWGLQVLAGNPAGSPAQYLLASGDAFFTLNYGHDVPDRALTHVLVIIEAGAGFGFVALTITYLPVLDRHFSQRDAKLITMSGRAGSPPTSVALLQWHARQANIEHLNEWLRSWELWSADLIESHSSYPMLAFYRSQHSNQSWLASLAIALDCCTLLLAGAEDTVVHQAECTFTAALRVLHEVCRGLDLHAAVGRPSRAMPSEEFSRIGAALLRSGYPWKEDEATRAFMAPLRASYEPFLNAISAYLLLPLPKWVLPVADGLDPAPASDREAIIARVTRIAARPDGSGQMGEG